MKELVHEVYVTASKPVTVSLYEFDTSSRNEEVFLLYSMGHENGPGIVRDGKCSPWMAHPNPNYLGQRTTDPDIQRFGTYFLNKELQQEDLLKLDTRIKSLSSTNELLRPLTELYKANSAQKNYIDEFYRAYPGYEIVAIQGIGDLTMNLWNVAYINSAFTKEPKFLHLFDERINDRTYSCLVKWKSGKLQISDLRFNRYLFNECKDDPKVVTINGEPVADKIEFAVYGQRMIHPGFGDSSGAPEVFDRAEIAHQFADIRHLLELPNLNPNQSFPIAGDSGRPRYYFGREQDDDIWFGEAELLENRNLRKAAITGSVELNTLHSGLGVSHDQVNAAMDRHRYIKVDHPTAPLMSKEIPMFGAVIGQADTCQWRFVSGEDQYVELKLRENRYPCTMVGLNEDGQFYMFAWNGIYSKEPGLTLRQSAFVMCRHGVANAILCDEGGDAFQYIKSNNSLSPKIKPSRGQMRAVFVVARRVTE